MPAPAAARPSVLLRRALRRLAHIPLTRLLVGMGVTSPAPLGLPVRSPRLLTSASSRRGKRYAEEERCSARG